MARYSSVGLLGRAILGLLILGLIVGTIGIWRGWWSFAVADAENDDQTEMRMTVDKGRIREDASTMASKARDARETAAVAADLHSVRGRVIDLDAERLTIETEEGKDHAFQLTEATEAERNGESTAPANLRPGVVVLVTYRESEGDKDALKIQVVEEAS